MMIALYVVMLAVLGIAGIIYGMVCLAEVLQDLYYTKLIEQHKKDGD